MTGIYKITNKINNKVYIGQSINIEKRWGEHKHNAFNQNTHTYYYPLYLAIRKYGLDSFVFEIIEECLTEELTIREQYWMDYYHSLDGNCGYNLVPAVDPKRGEYCNWAILTDFQVEQIENLLQQTTISMSQIGKMYQVSGSCIEDINKGRRRTKDNLQYPLRKNTRSIGHRGERQNTAILSESDVIEIRNRYVNEELLTIYEDYKDRISLSGFKNVVYGATWKHLPCYKKREKKWIFLDK